MEPASSQPIVREVLLDATAARVWKAITDKEEMKEWYFTISEFKPVPGFEFRFEGGTENKTYVHICRIIEVIPLKKLSHTWHYQGYEGTTTVTFELFEEGESTRLKLTHEGLENFAVNNNPDFDKNNFEQGWTHIIGSSIKNFIENQPDPHG